MPHRIWGTEADWTSPKEPNETPHGRPLWRACPGAPACGPGRHLAGGSFPSAGCPLQPTYRETRLAKHVVDTDSPSCYR